MQAKQYHDADSKTRGLSAYVILLPAVVLILALFVVIAGAFVKLGQVKNRLFEVSANQIAYSRICGEYRDYTDALSAQAGLYVTSGDAECLGAFFAQANAALPALPSAAAARLDAADVAILREADAGVGELIRLESVAMKLYATAIGRAGDLSAYPALEAVEIPAEYLALSADEQKLKAGELLLGRDCKELEQRIVDLANKAVNARAAETEAEFQSLSLRLRRYTRTQGLYTAIVCLVSVVVVILFYALFLVPLTNASKRIRSGKKIAFRHGLRELKYFSSLYDRLIDKKALLEDDLRQSARLDPLTGLPNRLAEKHFISSIRRSKANLPIAVLSLDVNNLKPTNDTRGHVAGDALLQTAAKCILACFGDETGRNCFRTGGDEFVAVLQDVTEAEVREKIAKFEQMQREENISVAVGYAYSDDVHPMDVDDLFPEADRLMYRNKSDMKRQMATDQLAMPLDAAESVSRETVRAGENASRIGDHGSRDA